MTLPDKKSLAQTYDGSPLAVGRRVRAGRKMTGLSQEAFGHLFELSKGAISHIENGRASPKFEIMHYLMDECRIDYNFIIAGFFSQLPGDVQDKLFSVLAAEEQASAQKDS